MPNDPASQAVEIADEQRSSVVEAINQSLEIFCCHAEMTFDEVMSNGLTPIAETVDANRIVVYRYAEIDGEKHLKLEYRWDRSGKIPDKSFDVLQNTPTVTGWMDILRQGLCINRRLRDMSREEAAFMSSFGIKAALFVPVFTHGELWGAIVLQDHLTERLFSAECVELAQSVAYLCTSVVMRNEMEQQVADKNEFNRILFETAPIGLTMFDEEDFNILDCNETVLKMYGITKQYYKGHFLNLLPEYQPDGTKSFDRFCDVVNRTLEGETIVSEWIYTSPAGDSIPCELTTTCAKSNGKRICLAYVYDLRSIKKMEKAITEAEERTRAVTEASPVSYILFNEGLQPIDCNNATLKTFGCSDKQYFLSNYWEAFSPVYQPDGQKSADKVATLKETATSYGTAIYEWTHKTLDGEMLPMENTMTHMVYKGERYFISHKHDLRNVKMMLENIRTLKTEAEKIYFDAMTGIHNRRYFDEHLDRLIKTLSRSNGKLSLMMIDVDFFKLFNDTYGHKEGDNCLKAVADALAKGVTRADDFVARYGGEEFAVVLPNTDEKGACMIAEKLRKAVQDRNIPHIKNTATGCVTISIGVTTSNVNHEQTVDDYIKHADEMLYKSKQSGRNKYSYQAL